MSALTEALRRLDISSVTRSLETTLYNNTKTAADLAARHLPGGEALMAWSEQACDAGLNQVARMPCEAVHDSNAARNPQPLAGPQARSQSR